MQDQLSEWKKERERLNEKILAAENLNIKRFFGLDSAVYRDGALGSKVKEMLGLACSTVLRCDDCITYHVIRCREEGVTLEEFEEIMSVALIVGGSITIPHVRRARDVWDRAQNQENE